MLPLAVLLIFLLKGTTAQGKTCIYLYFFVSPYLSLCTLLHIYKVAKSSLFSHEECDNGWLTYDEHCYFMSNDASLLDFNWHQARDYCLQEGGELASIHSQEEQDFIIHMVIITANVNYQKRQ